MTDKTSDTIRLTPEQMKREEHRIQAMRENLKRRKEFQKAMAQKAKIGLEEAEESDELSPTDLTKDQ